MIKMQFPELNKLIKQLHAARSLTGLLPTHLHLPTLIRSCHPHFVSTLAHAAAILYAALAAHLKSNIIDVAKMIRFNGRDLI